MHRFNPAAHYVIGLMDGRRTVQEIWDSAVAPLRRRRADAGRGDPAARPAACGRRAAGRRRRPTSRELAAPREARRNAARWLQKPLSPLSIRIPLFDPDRFLERWRPWLPAAVRLGRRAALAGGGGTALVLAGAHWPELTEDVTRPPARAAEPAAPVADLPGGQAAARVRPRLRGQGAWGGEVHEMGVMLLVLHAGARMSTRRASGAFPRDAAAAQWSARPA